MYPVFCRYMVDCHSWYEFLFYMAVCRDCPVGLGDLHEPGDSDSAAAHMVPAGMFDCLLFGMRFVFGTIKPDKEEL